MPKRLFLLVVVLVVGLIMSGCGLFNDVDLNDDEIVEEQSIADFLNSLVNSFGVLVQDFIDQTEEAEGVLEFPDADDLDFFDLFGHLDEFLDGPGGMDEEDFKLVIVEDLEYFVLGIEAFFDIERAEFNDTNIQAGFQYKYFMEVPAYYILENEQEYPQEELRFFLAMVEASVNVDEEEEKEFRMMETFMVEYDDGFKFLQAELYYLLWLFPPL